MLTKSKIIFTLMFILFLTTSLFGAASGVPGTPSLSHDNWDNDDNYTITMNMWWGNNGTSWTLYENGVSIGTTSLVDNSPNAQSATYVISGRANGTYTYTCKLTNSFGETDSSSITVSVVNGSGTPTPIPETPTPTATPTAQQGTAKRIDLLQERQTLGVIITNTALNGLPNNNYVEQIIDAYPESGIIGFPKVDNDPDRYIATSQHPHIQFEFPDARLITKFRTKLIVDYTVMVEIADSLYDMEYKTGTYQILIPETTPMATSDWFATDFANPILKKVWKVSVKNTGPAQTTYIQGIELYTVDNEAPTAPSNLTATAIDGRSIKLGWTASTDNVGVSAYKVYRNTEYIGSTTSTQYTDTLLDIQTAYTYKVCAVDSVGNLSTMSTDASATTSDSQTIKTDYNVTVLYYSPTIKAGTYTYHDPVLNQDLTKTIPADIKFGDLYNLYSNVYTHAYEMAQTYKQVSGGTVNFNLNIIEIDDFLPAHCPEVMNAQLMIEYMELSKTGHLGDKNYYFMHLSGFNYHKATQQNNLLPAVENGDVDYIWIYSDVETTGTGVGTWESYMGGPGAYNVNSSGTTFNVACSRKFIFVPGGGYECYGHMFEHIMGRITQETNQWPAVVNYKTFSVADPNVSTRALELHPVNDWFRFFTTENTNYHNGVPEIYSSPGNAAVGGMHFPPNAPYNYGAGYIIGPGRFKGLKGTWTNGYAYEAASTTEAISVAWDNNPGSSGVDGYENAMIFTNFDCSATIKIDTAAAGSEAGILFRATEYDPGASMDAYFAGINAATDTVSISKIVDGVYTEVATYATPIDVNTEYFFKVLALGDKIEVFFENYNTPVITYTIPDYVVDTVKNTGAVGFRATNTGISLTNIFIDPYARTHADRYYDYPALSGQPEYISSKKWGGDLTKFQIWSYDHVPRNPGVHTATDINTSQVYGGILNNWWPYLLDLNNFDGKPINHTVTGFPVPPVPELYTAEKSDSSITMAWSLPPASANTEGVKLYRDGVLILTTATETTYVDTNVTKNGTYTYSIVAYDAAQKDSIEVKETVTATSAFFMEQFDAAENGMPAGWETFTSASGTTFSVDTVVKRSGASSAKIVSTNPASAYFYKEIDVVQGEDYHLSAYVKTQDVVNVIQGGYIATVTLSFNNGMGDTYDLSLTNATNDWTELRIDFNADSATKVTIKLTIGWIHHGHNCTGTVWFDDLKITQDPVAQIEYEDGFENVSGSSVNGWMTNSSSMSTTTFSADSTVKRTGSFSAKITASQTADSYYSRMVGLTPNTNYRLTVYVKTENVVCQNVPGYSANVTLNFSPDLAYDLSLPTGTNDWTPLQVEFNSGTKTVMDVMCRLGWLHGNTCTGTAWFDDLTLEVIQ